MPRRSKRPSSSPYARKTKDRTDHIATNTNDPAPAPPAIPTHDFLPVQQHQTGDTTSSSPTAGALSQELDQVHLQHATTTPATLGSVMESDECFTFKPGRTLQDCLCKYLDEQIDTDVSFIVGEDKVVVKAHRTVLRCRSPVFLRMLSKAFDVGGDIEITDTCAEYFQTFLRFLYTDYVDLTTDNAISIMQLSDKYDVPLLLDLCVQFLTDNVDVHNACLIFATAKIYRSETLKSASLSFICMNEECLGSEEFLNLCDEDIQEISSNENLSCKEECLLESLCKWAEVRCTEKGKEPNDLNKRQILGDILLTVRFPLMNYDYLINTLSKGELITDSELKLVLQLRAKENKSPISAVAEVDDTDIDETDTDIPICQVFNEKARKAMQPKNVILETGALTLSKEVITQVQSVSFSVSDDSWFYGMIMYGPETRTRFAYELCLSRDNGIDMKNVSSFITSDGTSYTCTVSLDSPVLLKESRKYTCRIMIFSHPSCHFYSKRDDDEYVLEDTSVRAYTQQPRGISALQQTKVFHSASSVAKKICIKNSTKPALFEKIFRYKKLYITERSRHITGLMLF